MANNQEINSRIKLLASHYENLEIPFNKNIIEIDLGCGKGSFTTALAQKYPDRYIIAVDVLIGRLRKLTKRNMRLNIENLHPVKAEAWHFVTRCIPDASIDRLHVLCPDPWPKERHKGHRLISSEFAHRMSLKLKKNGVFHFATDDNNYYQGALKIISECNFFEPADEELNDIQDIKTDFEIRWNEMGLPVHHSAWRRII